MVEVEDMRCFTHYLERASATLAFNILFLDIICEMRKVRRHVSETLQIAEDHDMTKASHVHSQTSLDIIHCRHGQITPPFELR